MCITVISMRANAAFAVGLLMISGCTEMGTLIGLGGGEGENADDVAEVDGGSLSAPVTKTIGSEGGSINTTDGAEIVFPPGALSSDVEVTITPSATSPEDAIGPTYIFEPEGIAFAEDVMVTLPFSRGDTPEGWDVNVTVLTASNDSDDFVEIGGTLVDSTHIEVATRHFSKYTVSKVKPVALASTPANSWATGIKVDGANVFWTENTRLRKVALAGGTAAVVVNSLNDAKALVLNGTEVVFTEGGHEAATPGASTDSTVSVVAKTGGAKTVRVPNLKFAHALAVDAAGTRVYWSDWETETVASAALADGSGVVTLGTAQKEVSEIAVDATYVYWTAKADGRVMRKSLANSAEAPVVLASGEDQPLGLALDANYVYYTNVGSGTVKRVAKAGTNAPTIIANDPMTWPRALVVDGTNLYWTASNGQIRKMATTGGTGTILASNQDGPISLVVDGTYVYWVTTGNSTAGGHVRRVAK